MKSSVYLLALAGLMAMTTPVFSNEPLPLEPLPAPEAPVVLPAPVTEPDPGNTLPASNHNMRPYIGKKEADAGRAAKRRGLAWRVVEREGEALMITKDYRLDRVNFKVKNGKVYAAYRG